MGGGGRQGPLGGERARRQAGTGRRAGRLSQGRWRARLLSGRTSENAGAGSAAARVRTRPASAAGVVAAVSLPPSPRSCKAAPSSSSRGAIAAAACSSRTRLASPSSIAPSSAWIRAAGLRGPSAAPGPAEEVPLMLALCCGSEGGWPLAEAPARGDGGPAERRGASGAARRAAARGRATREGNRAWPVCRRAAKQLAMLAVGTTAASFGAEWATEARVRHLGGSASASDGCKGCLRAAAGLPRQGCGRGSASWAASFLLNLLRPLAACTPSAATVTAANS